MVIKLDISVQDGIYIATSKDLGGLMVMDKSIIDLFNEIPEVIKAIHKEEGKPEVEYCGTGYILTRAEAIKKGYIIPREKEERDALVRDFERVCHVGLSKFAEWVCKDAIGERINEINEVLKDG